MSNGRLTQVQFLPSLLEDACSFQLGQYLQPLQCCNLDYLVSNIASKKSSQETYVTIKYRLENNGSEPRLNDIGARLLLGCSILGIGSEPRLNDIGARRVAMSNGRSTRSEPRLNDIGVRPVSRAFIS